MTRIDGTVDSPPCLKVTHKTFGTQNSNNDMLYCRLSMPVEFYSADKLLEESLKLRSAAAMAQSLCCHYCFFPPTKYCRSNKRRKKEDGHVQSILVLEQ